MAPKEQTQPKKKFKKINLGKNSRDYLTELRHADTLTPVNLYSTYRLPESPLAAIIDELKDPESVFVFDTFLIMQARYESILADHKDDHSMQSTIPIIQTVNRIAACKQAFTLYETKKIEDSDSLEISDEQRKEFTKQLVLSSKYDDEGIAQTMRSIRTIFEVGTPPSISERGRSLQVDDLLLGVLKQIDAVADIPTEDASLIKAKDYALGSSTNRINVIDEKHPYIMGGDRHYLNTSRSINRLQMGSFRRYLVPGMDSSANKLVHQQEVFDTESAQKIFEWIQTLNFDMSIYEEKDDAVYMRKYLFNKFYDDFVQDAKKDPQLKTEQLQKNWIEFIGSQGVMERGAILKLIRNQFPHNEIRWLEFLSPQADRNEIYKIISDYLLLDDEIQDAVAQLQELRINEGRELNSQDVRVVIEKIRPMNSD